MEKAIEDAHVNDMLARAERTLASSRLGLEPIQGRHGELLFDLLQESSIYTYIPTEPPESRSALRTRYEWLAQRQSPEGDETWLNWAIRLNEPTFDNEPVHVGTYIGTVQVTICADGTALLAYELGSEYRRAGYATEACRTVMQEMVEGYDVAEMRAYVDTRNERSILLLERLGFGQTAHIPQADFFKGSASDEYVYTWIAPSKPRPMDSGSPNREETVSG